MIYNDKETFTFMNMSQIDFILFDNEMEGIWVPW